MPIGEMGGPQTLHRITRTTLNYRIEQLETVFFVPFLSGKE
jgi:protein-L-isoaspartate(D-aspartate) O-methyltransferase